MSFKVTDAHRLQIESDRVQGMLEMEANSGKDWEEIDFIRFMSNLGLDYTNVELVAIRDELVNRGVIELLI